MTKSFTLADILQNASDDVLKANGLARKKSTQPQPKAQPEPQEAAHRSKGKRTKRARGTSKPKGPSEHDEQVTLFNLAANYPEFASMFAIPNGGFRTKATAGKLKAEGVKSGVPDIFLPYPSRHYHGMFIEMKIPGNKPTENQTGWLQQLATNGYYCIVAYGAVAALDRLLWYIGKGNKQ